MTPLPHSSIRGTRHLVASADQLATRAGDLTFERGGNAVDAAIATNAAIAVTGPHMCGMGGDLFALVHRDGEVVALNSSGRAGSGAAPDSLRAEGHTVMPFHHDIRTVTVPGCVDGWLALHERFGSLLACRRAGTRDRSRRGRLPGKSAPRWLGAPARRRRPPEPRRAVEAGGTNRCDRAPSGCRSRSPRHRRARSRRLLRR